MLTALNIYAAWIVADILKLVTLYYSRHFADRRPLMSAYLVFSLLYSQTLLAAMLFFPRPIYYSYFWTGHVTETAFELAAMADIVGVGFAPLKRLPRWKLLAGLYALTCLGALCIGQRVPEDMAGSFLALYLSRGAGIVECSTVSALGLYSASLRHSWDRTSYRLLLGIGLTSACELLFATIFAHVHALGYQGALFIRNVVGIAGLALWAHTAFGAYRAPDQRDWLRRCGLVGVAR